MILLHSTLAFHMQHLKKLWGLWYRVRDSEYIVAGMNGDTYWSGIPCSSSAKHNIMLVAHMEYLIDNIYVSIGNGVHRQCVEIPMGTNCAPLLANLFIFHHEYKYMRNLIKMNLMLAKKSNNIYNEVY